MDSYKLKYEVTYANIVGDNFSLEIYQKSDFDFIVQKTAGTVIFTKGNVDDIFEPLRATSLTINLEASQNNLLEDFQSFNEFDFKVKFYRNELQIFEGWINPDGYFQDWVNDKWIISMTAVDGLGTLKNLEFSDKITISGLPETKEEILSVFFIVTDTTLIIQTIGNISWADLGFNVGNPFQILDGVNIGSYIPLSISFNSLVSTWLGATPTFSGPSSATFRWTIANGNPEFTYAPRELNYLHAVLKRLGYELPYTIGDDINVELGVNPEWVDVKKRIIDREVFINNNGTFQDCETVLKDILQKYNLTITQENIENRLVWYISRVPYAIYLDEQKINRQYNTVIDANAGVAEVLIQQFAFANGYPKQKLIYSDINSSEGDVIHCNENQQITFKPALQNFRFQSTWKGLRNFLGAIPDFWSEIPPMPIYPNAGDVWGIFDGYMRMWQVFTVDLVNDPWFESINIRPPSPIETVIEVVINWWVDYNFVNPAVEVPAPVKFRYVLQYITDSFTRYYNADDEIWQTTPKFIQFEGTWPTPGVQTVGVVEGEYRLTAPLGGVDPSGRYKISIYSPFGDNTGYHECRLTNVQFLFDVSQFGTGKVHDSTQPKVKSTFLNNPVNVINTNEPNAYFQNNLYRLASILEQVTGLVAMNNWKATNTPTFDDLLELTGRERIRAKARPQRVFRGDVFNYIPYSSVIKYDGINGFFVPLSYQYITAENIIQLESAQVFNENVEIEHEKRYIYENERNVLIKEK